MPLSLRRNLNCFSSISLFPSPFCLHIYLPLLVTNPSLPACKTTVQGMSQPTCIGAQNKREWTLQGQTAMVCCCYLCQLHTHHQIHFRGQGERERWDQHSKHNPHNLKLQQNEIIAQWKQNRCATKPQSLRNGKFIPTDKSWNARKTARKQWRNETKTIAQQKFIPTASKLHRLEKQSKLPKDKPYKLLGCQSLVQVGSKLPTTSSDSSDLEDFGSVSKKRKEWSFSQGGLGRFGADVRQSPVNGKIRCSGREKISPGAGWNISEGRKITDSGYVWKSESINEAIAFASSG